jgi:hypothetical protein
MLFISTDTINCDQNFTLTNILEFHFDERQNKEPCLIHTRTALPDITIMKTFQIMQLRIKAHSH